MASSDPHVHDRPAVPFIGTTTGVTLATFAEIADRIPVLIGALISHGTPRPARRSSGTWRSGVNR